MDIHDAARANLDRLRSNPYPGRGIVVGLSPDARAVVQVYWIMGRSGNSRNRVFVREGETVRTAPLDPSKVKDPSLVIYNCVRTVRRAHVVTNGDHTDTIAEALRSGGTFEEALATRTYEPDAPNFTPRIAGVADLDDSACAYRLAILKRAGPDSDSCVRCYFCYERGIAGVGHFISTYAGDANPLPPFTGEPLPVPLLDDPDATARLYWDALNGENRVALLVKSIDMATSRSTVRIVNRHRG